MRLILSGGGNPEDVIPLDELFISQIDLQSTVLYIPVAMEEHVFSYEECYKWFKKTYEKYGITNIKMCTDLTSIQSINQYTAIFIGGGNTFKLLKEVKESKFDIKLTDYLNNNGLIYGGSAGAIIFGKTIKSASYADDNNVNLRDLSGLNLICGKDIFCHYSDKDNEYIKNYENDLYVLYEESGLFIHDNKVESIGKMFLLKNDIINCSK